MTDLLLFCKQMPDSKAEEAQAKMWLMFPPLAGKHLRVSRVDDDECQFRVDVMRKETVHITVSSRAERDHWIMVLEEAIDYGSIR